MRKRGTQRHFKLPVDLADKLALYCAVTGEDAADVLADALALHLDVEEGLVADRTVMTVLAPFDVRNGAYPTEVPFSA